jgi:Apea-like HEPN
LTAPLHEDMGTLTVGPDEHSYEQATIRPGDLPKLQTLAAAVWVNLPIGHVGLPEAEPTPVTTAFRRYCDALLRDGTILERRFASAVMGLESLYLPAKQDGELSFRLRTGVGRVMEELGFDGRAVEAEVAYCYGVRSAYVHGGHLSGKLRASGEKKFGNLQDLLRRLLNYLRVSIVMSLLLELPKEDLLTAVNDAMVSAKGSLGLAQILSPAKKLIEG